MSSRPGGGLAPLIWPFHSHTFPLLTADQLAASPSRTAAVTSASAAASSAAAAGIGGAAASIPQQSANVPPVNPLLPHPLHPLTLMSHESEKRVRAIYIMLILHSGRLLELPNLTITTACVYWHRFYSLHSLLVFHPSLAAAACLFLASKADENTRRVRDIINVVYRVEFMHHQHSTTMQTPMHQQHPSASPSRNSQSSFNSINSSSSSNASSTDDYLPNEFLLVSPLFWSLKEEVLRFEQKLLRVLNYEMKIYHAHSYLLHFTRELECSEEVARLAYYITNESRKSTLCLQYGPHAIACASIYLSSEILAEQIRFHPMIIKELNTNTTTTAAASNPSSASPYRSPHPSNPVNMTSSTPSASAAASTNSSSSSSLLISSNPTSEWWEYFGRVNQLEMEDLTHRLIDELEIDDAEIWYEDGASLHEMLREIVEEEEGMQQRGSSSNEGSAQYQTYPQESDETPRYTARTPTHMPPHKLLERRTSLNATTPTSSAMSVEYPSAPYSTAKPPHRLQLHNYTAASSASSSSSVTQQARTAYTPSSAASSSSAVYSYPPSSAAAPAGLPPATNPLPPAITIMSNTNR